MDEKNIAYGIIEGISSIPGGMYRGAVRTWQGSGLSGGLMKDRNQQETERFIMLLRSVGNKEQPIRRLITIIMTDFYKKLNDAGKEAVNNKVAFSVGYLSGKTGAQFFLAHTATRFMLKKSLSTYAYRTFIKYGTSFSLNMLMTQGLIEEAAEASRRLRVKYPQTYSRVSREYLDMVYFLVESQLEPYVAFINSHPMICKGIENELCKILANKAE